MSSHAPASEPRISIERVYTRSAAPEGRLFLVDRLWPRGLSREDLAAATWLPEVAPSRELRKWFAHEPHRWAEFQRRYRQELREQPATWQTLADALGEGPITLLFAARDTEHCNAVVLRDFLLSQAKASRAAGSVAAARTSPGRRKRSAAAAAAAARAPRASRAAANGHLRK